MMSNLVPLNFQVYIKSSYKAADDCQYWEVTFCVET